MTVTVEFTAMYTKAHYNRDYHHALFAPKSASVSVDECIANYVVSMSHDNTPETIDRMSDFLFGNIKNLLSEPQFAALRLAYPQPAFLFFFQDAWRFTLKNSQPQECEWTDGMVDLDLCQLFCEGLQARLAAPAPAAAAAAATETAVPDVAVARNGL